MKPTAFSSSRWLRYSAIVVVWGFANVVALLAIDAYELRRLAETHGLSPDVIRRFEDRFITITSSDGSLQKIRYRLLEPDVEIQSERTFPVMLFLHGAGERGYDNVKSLKSLPSVLSSEGRRASFPCFLVIPQCPPGTNWSAFAALASSEVGQQQNLLRMILDDVLLDSRADARRVYLVGFSMGAIGAWHLAATFPTQFAAVVPIAGGGHPQQASSLVDVPVWAVHGLEDTVIRVEAMRNTIEALRRAGGKPKYSELIGVGHGAWRPAFEHSDEILRWMFRQARRDADSTLPPRAREE